MTIVDDTISDGSSLKSIKVVRTNKDKDKESIWLFPDSPRSGTIDINVQSTDDYFPVKVIGGLLQFITDWVAIGAKTQMGFGVIAPVNGRFDTKPLYDWLTDIAGDKHYQCLPTLQNVFITHVKLNGATPQATFDMKYDLCRLFDGVQNTELRHFIMGCIVKGGRMAAKVKMSRLYGEGLMRIWGWIPKEALVYNDKWSRESVVDAIYKYLQDKCGELDVWREMNSPRDTIMPNNGDASAFLRSLLKLGDDYDAL